MQPWETRHRWRPCPCARRYAGLLYGSLAADSLALAPHWIYDQGEIARRFGRPDELQPPHEDGYHFGKPEGAQTHYGDQTLVLMESLEACGGNFVVEDFARRWRRFWETSKAYRDHATLDTLANLEAGRGIGAPVPLPRNSAGPAASRRCCSRCARRTSPPSLAQCAPRRR
ncbi:MAG: ADP-ribosylglycohydrolase family protein [Verrucomicrobiota bacterium]